MEGSWDEYFAARTWRVAKELSGEVSQGPAKVRFSQGLFTIIEGKFCGPGSSARGTKGVLLQETGPDGKDIAGSRVAVGQATMRMVRKSGAVK